MEGLVVPIPTLPEESTLSLSVEPPVAITNSFSLLKPKAVFEPPEASKELV